MQNGPIKTKYGWEAMLNGEWHLAQRNETSDTATNAALNGPPRVSAYKWARAHGYRVRTSASRGGRELYVKFTKRDGS